MNNIRCKDHPDNQIIFITWNSTIVKFICDECMAIDLQEGDLLQKQCKKMAIKKAIKEPEYFFTQFSLDEKNKTFFSAFKKFPDVELMNIIEKTKQNIQYIQLILDSIMKELQSEINKLINNKDIVRKQLNKVSQYQEFKELIQSLNKKQKVTHDAVRQIEIQLEKIFLGIEKNSSDFNQEIKKAQEISKIDKVNDFLGIEQLRLQIEQFKQISAFFMPVQKPIVPEEYFQYLLNKISLGAKKQIKFTDIIFDQQKDNLNSINFWNCVKDKENLLMIFKSQSGNIFGAYTPIKWVYEDTEIMDHSCNSFLFSYTHKSIHQNNKGFHALNLQKYKGPCFGQKYLSIDFDLYIEGDFQKGYSNLGKAYTKESSQDSKTHLFGQETPNIIQCQIFQIIFK
ncbi:unnamed protein product [Paramecium sonneborni]|uniref:TLDc domain-containing protein n=1 Tax=Paramecium sonneborni TaxID=65129 RepID=A0A8S1NUI7_9CILI|nr:unnamed protein product [Paramecium sonneborni]